MVRVRRILLTLVVAIAMGAAPVAMAICQAWCADDSHHEVAGSDAHHACHQTMEHAQASVQLEGVHVCGHTDELPSASQPAPIALDAEIVETTNYLTVRDSQTRPGVVATEPSPPDRVFSSIPLRI